MSAESSETCGERVFWWDGEYEGVCELPKGHDPPHFDGLSWFNDDHEEVAPPEKPSAILASHAVPYGKVFRQWFTDGKLRVWVNRGEVEDLPRAEHGIEIFNDALLPVVPSWSGLPVYNV